MTKEDYIKFKEAERDHLRTNADNMKAASAAGRRRRNKEDVVIAETVGGILTAQAEAIQAGLYALK